MSKVLVYSNLKFDEEAITKPLKDVGYVVSFVDDFSKLYDITESFLPDIVILSLPENTGDISLICRKIRLIDQSSDVQIILLLPENANLAEISQGADGYLQYPLNSPVLIATVNAHLRIKNLLNVFSTNNTELANRYYQLKVMYDTSSKLAGTLNRRKLINIMNDGLQLSMSYSLCSTLIINNPDDVLLLINTACPITKRLEQALKLRAIITYKSMFEKTKLPFDFDINTIKTEVNVAKNEGLYDLEVMSFSSIFAPISTKDKFFGTVELMREVELSGEDTTCFQTLVSLVPLPLESAILYEEIQDKNEKLTKLEHVKSEFLSIVSHELRTPLTAINNALFIILSGKTGQINEDMSKFLNMGKKNVERLAGMINAILDLSKIEAGKMEYHFEKSNIVEPINNAYSTCNATAVKNKTELTLQVLADNTEVYCDVQKIEQVVTNLVGNALKFTPENGKINIIVTENPENKTLITEIKDTGIGISKENISKVFDKFQQIESSLSRKVGGTGLGLPIAKEFILSHRGNIWVESEENVGTSFYFSIPKYEPINCLFVELSMLFEKSLSTKSAFGIFVIKSAHTDKIENFFNKEIKYKKLFKDNEYLYVLTQTCTENIFNVYVEKLQNFIDNLNDDTISLKTKFLDFNKNINLNDVISELNTEV